MFAAWPELLVAGTPFGSPNPPVCTSSRGFFKVGIAELPVPTLPGVNVGGIAFATSGASGAAVFLFEVAGLVIGDVNTGVWMRGFGGTTIAGLGISLATSTLGMIFSTGLGGCGLIRLLLDHSAIESCLALHVGQHDFAEFLHLLSFLICHLGGHVERQQAAVGALRLGFQILDQGDLTVELLALQPGGAHRAYGGI